MAVTDAVIADRIRDVVTARAPTGTCCPSEIARALAPDDWRPLMPRIRCVAARLACGGEIVVTQRGVPVDMTTARGPIRLGAPKRG